MNEGDTFTLGSDRWEVVTLSYLGIQNLFGGWVGSMAFGGFGMGSRGARHVHETLLRNRATDEHRCAIIASDMGGRIEVNFEIEIRGQFAYAHHALDDITRPPTETEPHQ